MNHWESLSGSATGALACLAAAASYGICYVYMQRYPVGRGLSPLVLATAQITGGALILMAGAPLLGPITPRPSVFYSAGCRLGPRSRPVLIADRSSLDVCA
jgi:drug/metabolite transporter (DMT)-like permease